MKLLDTLSRYWQNIQLNLFPWLEVSRLEKQKEMQLEEMLSGLPKGCDVGSKRNSKGYLESWTGYKLHLDVTDNQIPISCILTSASVHDSQVALPLAETTKQRVTNLYDLMDSAYDSPIIRDHSRAMGHVPIIDINPRRNTKLEEELKAEVRRLETLGINLNMCVQLGSHLKQCAKEVL